MIAGLGLIAPLFFFFLIGVIAQKMLRYTANGQKWLDVFIFYVALPALLFQSVRVVRVVRVVPAGVTSLPAFLALGSCQMSWRSVESSGRRFP